jgi:hypothetical protein
VVAVEVNTTGAAARSNPAVVHFDGDRGPVRRVVRRSTWLARSDKRRRPDFAALEVSPQNVGHLRRHPNVCEVGGR